jgi:hypothetical protein
MNEVCCFCGTSEPEGNLLRLIIIINDDGEEQEFVCHKKCFVDRIIPGMILHPDLLESDTDS